MLKIGKLCMSKTLTTAIQIFFITPSDLSSFPFNYCLFDFVWCVCDANSRFSATLIGSSVLKFMYDFL